MSDSAGAMHNAPPPLVRMAELVRDLDTSAEGRDLFAAAVQSTRMPVVVADLRLLDAPIVFVNQAFLDMTGYAREEVMGRNCRFLQGPDTDRQAVQQVREAVQSAREITIELLNYRKDGSTFWNALFMTPVRNAQGEAVYIFSSQLDISRRRDAEAALHHAQKMEALGQLTGGIAHDYNNLQQIILGNADLARMLLRGHDDPRLTRALDNIREASRKSGLLTQQLLAFARKQQLQGRVVNLGEHLAQWSDLAQRTLGDRIVLRHQSSADLWKVRIDPTQAEMALHNLLMNAREAMPSGGQVTLSVENIELDAEGAGTHGVPGPGRFVVLSVSDTGHGIAPDIIGRVMDPFFTTKTQGEGTGLGLSMVYGFARQSGGTATLRSQPGAGTTVRLYFAAVEDAATTRVPDAQMLQVNGAGRVLIVDDRPEVAEMAAMVLEAAGYTCEQCFHAEAALALMDRGEAFQLLLTDLIMPGGMNGVLLAREAQRRQPGLRVLLMTGFADGTPDRWGGQHYELIQKPFSADDLQRRVRRLLASAVAPG